MAHHVQVGQAVHRAEKEAIDFLVENLPSSYLVYSNVELATGRPGQTFEHDAIVVAPHAVFTVEIKSWGGVIKGNRDRWTLSDGAMWHSPIPPTQSKARVLKGRLKARRADLSRVWVQGLIFLSAADADPHISPDYADLVTTRRDVITALTDPSWFHLQGWLRPGQRNAIESVLGDGQPRRAPESLGSKFKLIEKLDSEGRPYEAWVAEEALNRHRHVLHIHTLTGDSKQEREALERHALREATLHQRLRGGPNILRYDTYFFEEDPHRIVLQFEDTTPLLPLPTWVQDHHPSLVTRLQVARRLVDAVTWVHKRTVTLRGLTADVVLVSPEEHPETVRLCAFDVAKDTSSGSTTVVGSGIKALRTSAPEVLKSGIADEVSDLFSLGATLYELFAGRPLFDSTDAIVQPFTVPPVDVGGRRLPGAVHTLLVRLLDTNGLQRPKAAEALEILDEAIHVQTQRRYQATIGEGSVVRDTYELRKRLGRGATATTWLAQHLQTEQPRVLKISSSESAEMLAQECAILTQVHHPNLVRAFEVGPEGEHQVLVLEHVQGFTGREQVEAGDPPGPEAFRAAAKGLFEAVAALHDAGWIHRDVKPENLIFRSDELEPVLLDLGLACPSKHVGELTVGTPRYKDPLVYAEERWSKANDVYAVTLVLAELLTGAHPFGGRAPDEDRTPEVAIEEVSDAFDRTTAEHVVAALLRGLDSRREERPSDARNAWADLENALEVSVSEQAESAPDTETPSEPIRPGTPVLELPLSTRAQGALARLKVRTAADLAGLDAKAARRLPNVGAKTQRELERWASDLAARWPDLAPRTQPPPEPELYPALRLDDRPLTDLGSALTPHFRQALQARNIRTIGHLAGASASTLLAIPRFGEKKLRDVREALARLAGSQALPPSLRHLDESLQTELGPRRHALLAAVVGLHDGQVRTLADAARLHDVTRQRVDQAADLTTLRAPASEGAALVRLMHEVLPPAGFAPLDFVAAAIADRLGEEPGVSARGYAVLGALLLDEDKRASHAPSVEAVFRSPWTPDALDAASRRLASAVSWPYRRSVAEREAWEALPENLQVALVRRGCDASQLLAALLRLVPDVMIDPYGALYIPPLGMVDVLKQHRRDLLPQADPATVTHIVEVVQSTWHGVQLPEDMPHALRAAGWREHEGRWYDPDRYEPVEEPEAPVVDEDVPRQPVRSSSVPPVVQALAAAAEVGGVRVVAMPPGRAHDWTHQLVAWLKEELGETRPVHLVHLDRVVIQALKDGDLWSFVSYQEQAPEADQDWGWAHEVIEAALERELGALGRDAVTVLGDPALIGSMGLMHWLSGFYERARGGRHGLIVLAMPGGVHDNRVRLNERYNLPYTPDMAAVYLEEVPA